MSVLLIIGIILLALVASFLLVAGLMWVICWAFSLIFSWKLVIGVWAILALLSEFLGPRDTNSRRKHYDY